MCSNDTSDELVARPRSPCWLKVQPSHTNLLKRIGLHISFDFDDIAKMTDNLLHACIIYINQEYVYISMYVRRHPWRSWELGHLQIPGLNRYLLRISLTMSVCRLHKRNKITRTYQISIFFSEKSIRLHYRIIGWMASYSGRWKLQRDRLRKTELRRKGFFCT